MNALERTEMRHERKTLFSRPRHGVSIIWVAVSMVALLGFCSLAVDLGRVQAVKTQLEIACDAAARAGAANLSSGWSAVQSASYYMAQANTADGSPVAINSNTNIALLDWPSTTALSSAQIASANAVQVNASLSVPLLFAQVLGMPTATVHASSTAYANTTAASGAYGIVGLTSATFTGGSTDSYNSSLGTYASQTPGTQGSVASNGQITVDSGSTIHGNVYYAGSAPTINSVGGVCTGSQTYVGPNKISETTPSAPPGATSLGNIDITYSALNQTLTSGNYTCTGITVDSGCTLTINATTGPVNIYCSGSVAGNGGNIAVTGNIPNNFHLYMTNSSSVQMNSGSYWYMVIDAPLSSVSLTASAALYGSVISATLTVDSSTNIHYDQALGTNGSGQSTTTISQVQ
jgi:hypothetical protein